MSIVQEVKERSEIVEIVSQYVTLQKSGRNFKALCPFHTEKTPSFIVFPERQSWHCFGACATGGDVFTFLMKIENIDFPEALRILARRVGVLLAPRTPAQEEEDRQRKRLVQMNSVAAQYFHRLLLESGEARTAREHLSKRDIDPSSWEAFQLGYSPPEWETLLQHLRSLGYKEEEILAAGLATQGERGIYDRFRGRLMFSIFDLEGQVIGFGARSLDDSEPKYLNSPETPLFNKGSVLYGVHLAKGAIREKDQAIIVEGYTDVIMAHQKGFRHVVASMGTALTENQVRILKRLTRRMVLALDADVAGEEATRRGLEVMQSVLRDHMVPVPWGRNLIEFEVRLDAQIQIAILPSEQDPADLLRESPQVWEEAIAQAAPVMDYYFDLAASRFDLGSAHGKSEATRLLLPLIRELKSEVEQEHYFQKLSRLIRVDERRLRREAVPPRIPSSRDLEERRGPISGFPGFTFGLETHMLLLLLDNPARVRLVDELLEACGADPLEDADFTAAEDRVIFQALVEQIPPDDEEWDSESLSSLLETALGERLQGLLELHKRLLHLLAKEGDRGAMLGGLRLRTLRLLKEIEYLRFLLEEEVEGEAQERLKGEVGRRATLLDRLWEAMSSLNQKKREPLWSPVWPGA